MTTKKQTETSQPTSKAAAKLKNPVIIRGEDSNSKISVFKFEVVSAQQQQKERNSAYQFFSID